VPPVPRSVRNGGDRGGAHPGLNTTVRPPSRTAYGVSVAGITYRVSWRPVVGYEGLYEVSDRGDVRRAAAGKGARAGRVLRGQWDGGYRRVTLYGAGRRRAHGVHQLVAAAFIGPCPPGLEVNYRDGDKANNRPGNLEYTTSSGNRFHAYRLGLAPSGERHRDAKLTERDVTEIRRRYKPWVCSFRRLAREFGVHDSTVRQVVAGRTWKQVPA
jgi:HNH endonuclease/NUMOD4 motif